MVAGLDRESIGFVNQFEFDGFDALDVRESYDFFDVLGEKR